MDSRQLPAEAVYSSQSKKDCLSHALVLEAVGIGHDIISVPGGFTLIVAAQDATRARAELEAYVRENRDWPARASVIPETTAGWGAVLGYAAVLLLVAIFAQQQAFGFDWFAAGKTNAGLIREGQWWRATTALTLHIDLLHLVSNIVIGGLVVLFASQLFGLGLAWLSILIGGTAGNLINACIRHSGHTSVGASTAVFAALGILAAYAWSRRRHIRGSKLARWAPLVGGVVLLGYLGTGGVRTDVTAHVAGFLSGALVGAVYGKLGDRLVLTAGAQFLSGIGALTILVLAWVLALSSHATQLSQ